MRRFAVVFALSISTFVLTLGGQENARDSDRATSFLVPQRDIDDTLPRLRAAIERYRADEGSLSRSDSMPMSAERSKRRDEFYRTWLKTLEEINFDGLEHSGKLDYVLLRNH